MTKTQALKPGTTVKPANGNAYWADLRGYIVRAENGNYLVKWDMEAMGADPLQAYWMIEADVAKADGAEEDYAQAVRAAMRSITNR